MGLLALRGRKARNIPSSAFPLFNAVDFQGLKTWQRKIFFSTVLNLSLDLAKCEKGKRRRHLFEQLIGLNCLGFE